MEFFEHNMSKLDCSNPHEISQFDNLNDDMPHPIQSESPPRSGEAGIIDSQITGETYTSKYEIPSDLRVSDDNDDA